MGILSTMRENISSMTIVPIMATVMALGSIGQSFAQNAGEVLPKGKPAVEQNAGFKLDKTDERVVYSQKAIDAVKENIDPSLHNIVTAVANTTYEDTLGNQKNLLESDTNLNATQVQSIKFLRQDLNNVNRNLAKQVMNQSLSSAQKLEITPVDSKDLKTSIAALSPQELNELNSVADKYTLLNSVKMKPLTRKI